MLSRSLGICNYLVVKGYCYKSLNPMELGIKAGST